MHISKKDCQKLSDENLVKKSLDNIKYFACLFERYDKKLIRYILRISNFSLEESNDVLQEAFIKMWKNLNQFNSDLKFSNWAYRIVHNTAISEWKKIKSRGQDGRMYLHEDLFSNLPSEINLENQLDKENRNVVIGKILNSLPIKYKDVLVLRFLEEKSYNEISDILKKPPGTIAILIHRAKKSFKENMEKSQKLI